MKKFNLGFYVASALSGLFGVVACSSSTPVNNNNTETRQCSTNQDCENLGGDFRGRVCSAEGVCEVKDQTPIAADASDTGCVSDDKCTSDLGYPSLCPTPGGKCVQWGNEHCEVTGDWKAEKKMVFGAVAASDSPTPSFVGFGPANLRANQMAFEELQSTSIDGKKLVLVTCRTTSEIGVGKDKYGSVKHLINTVDVDMMFSQTIEDANEATTLFEAGARQRPLMVTGTVFTVRNFVQPAQAPNLFQRLQSDFTSAPLFQDQLADFETRWRAAGNTRELRVMQIGWEGYTREVTEAVRSKLNFNGKSAAGNGANFKYLAFPQYWNSAKWLNELDVVDGFDPDVIVLTGADEMTRSTLPYLESKKSFKYIVISHITANNFPSVVGTNADLAARTVGAGAPFVFGDVDYERFIGFNSRAAARFPTVSSTQSPSFWVYDAAYLSVWAAAAAGPITGKLSTPDFVRGLKNVFDPTGAKVAVGPANIGQISAAFGGTKFNLQGALCGIGMDPDKGTPNACLSLEACNSLVGGVNVSSPGTRGLVAGSDPSIFFGEPTCRLPL